MLQITWWRVFDGPLNFADLGTRSIRLYLELDGRHRDRFPANITMSHIDTGDVLWAHRGA